MGQGYRASGSDAVRPDGRRWAEPEGSHDLVTVHGRGELPLIPEWLVQRIRATKANAPAVQAPEPMASLVAAGLREARYAAAALERACVQVARTGQGRRNEALNSAAFALGRMVGAGWIDATLVRSRLTEAARTCGLINDDGMSPTRGTIESGLTAGMRDPHPPLPEREEPAAGDAAVSEWAEPDLSYLVTGRSDPVPFPTDCLGPFWAAWVKAHAASRCTPVDYVAAGLLASVSSLIGNARWCCATPEWKEPPVLWVTIVGSPSAGKSPALDPVLALVREIEKEGFKAAEPARKAYSEALELARAHEAEWQRTVKEALRDGKTPPPRPTEAEDPKPVPLPRIVVSDTTPERLCTLLRDNPKGLLLFRDEIAGWMGSFGRYSSDAGGEKALWLEAYGGRAYTIDRQKDAEPTLIPHLAVAVLGGIQPEKLPLVTGGAEDGFAARFLWVWPEPVGRYRLQREPVDSTQHLVALRRLSALSLVQGEDGDARPGLVPLSDPAAEHFERYVDEIKGRAHDAAGAMQGVLGKAPGHVLRLALVLEYLAFAAQPWSVEPACIGESAMLSAIGLVDGYFLPMAQRVFGEAAIPQEDRWAAELARWIRNNRPRGFNARTARRTARGALREAKAMSAACDVLVQAGWIRLVQRAPDKLGGRAPSDYEVNPTLLAQ